MKSKPTPQLDVLVLGEHPAAYLSAMLLQQAKVHTVHACIPGPREPDRLVVINPAFFSLHPGFESLKRKLDMTSVYGLRFQSDDPAVHSEYRSKSVLAYVASYAALRTAVAKAAEAAGVELVTPKQIEIHRLDEKGVELTLNHKTPLRPKLLVVSNDLPLADRKLIGLPEGWGPDVVYRYSYLKLNGGKWADLGSRPVLPMSLNLRDTYFRGWLLPGPKCLQLAVEQPIESAAKVRAGDLLAHWAKVLHQAGVLAKAEVPLDEIETADLPLAGALAQEGLANRTLLVGPAGGFYSAVAEDIYPNTWSAVFAADAIKKALKEPHLQDALQPFRGKWRTTLGEYLRGPQQNFRFLLPLVYRNEVMTTRLTECILLGKAVVR